MDGLNRAFITVVIDTSHTTVTIKLSRMQICLILIQLCKSYEDEQLISRTMGSGSREPGQSLVALIADWWV